MSKNYDFGDWLKNFVKIYKDRKDDKIYKHRFSSNSSFNNQFKVILRTYENIFGEYPQFYRSQLLLSDIISIKKMELKDLIENTDPCSFEEWRIFSNNVNILVDEMEIIGKYKQMLETKHKSEEKHDIN